MNPALLVLERGARLTAGVFLLAVTLGGCAFMAPQTAALRDARPAGLPERVELAEVPFFPQKDYECGPAALATALASFGAAVTPEDLVGEVYLPARQGSLQVEMLAAPRRHDMVSYQLRPRFEDLLREVAAGIPVIVLQDYGVWPVSIWHYAVVVGYDYASGEVVLRSGEKRRLSMPFAVLEYTWKESGYWAMVTVPPTRIPATATEAAYLAAVLALARIGTPAVLKQAYTALLERWPDNLAASIGLANAHYAAGDLAATEATLRRASLRHPDAVAVRNNLAQALSDQGRDDEALIEVERALAAGGAHAAAVLETRDLIVRRREQKK
jgi:tetratricopeptide (TPR) repeat protein